MNNTTNNPKAKKNRIFKLTHLAIIMLILLLAIALRNNAYVLKAIHLIKPSTTTTVSNTNPNSNLTPTTSVNTSNNNNSNDITTATTASSINTNATPFNNNVNNNVILSQLQQQIEQLKQSLQLNTTNNAKVAEPPVVDKSTAVIVNALHQLIQQIQTQQSFANQLDILQNLKINESTATIIAKLQPYKNYKFIANSNLPHTYSAINKQIYLQYLKQQTGAIALIKYFALNLVYVTNSNYNQYNKNDIRYLLNYINFLINTNNLTLAKNQLQQLITTYDINLDSANILQQQLSSKIALQQAVIDIKQDITNYLK